jgi:hypothetical protein
VLLCAVATAGIPERRTVVPIAPRIEVLRMLRIVGEALSGSAEVTVVASAVPKLYARSVPEIHPQDFLSSAAEPAK